MLTTSRPAEAISPPPVETGSPELQAEEAVGRPGEAAPSVPDSASVEAIRDLESQLANKDTLITSLQEQLSTLKAQEV
jgi:hypothetical protein